MRTLTLQDLILDWIPYYSYTAGQRIITDDGQILKAKTDFQTTDTFDPNNWDVISSGGGTGLSNTSGPLANLPADGSVPDNSTYFADDENNGTPYRMVNGVWVQEAAGVSEASGSYAAGPVKLTNSIDFKAVANAITDMPGMSINVPDSPTRSIRLRFVSQILGNGGTSPVGSLVIAQLFLTDNANAVKAGSFVSVVSFGVSVLQAANLVVELDLPAPVAAGTYKLRYKTSAAIPANWSAMLIDPTALANIPNGSNDFVAEYK